MPVKRLRIGSLSFLIRYPNQFSLQRVVVTAVLKLVADTTTYFKMMGRSNRHVALIEQAV